MDAYKVGLEAQGLGLTFLTCRVERGVKPSSRKGVNLRDDIPKMFGVRVTPPPANRFAARAYFSRL